MWTCEHAYILHVHGGSGAGAWAAAAAQGGGGRGGIVGTIHNLHKFILASVRRRLRNFLKNTGKFQCRPLDVLESFSKTQ